jgi:phosphoglycerol transferase MdoB-like AlkP superfamily enzyme
MRLSGATSFVSAGGGFILLVLACWVLDRHSLRIAWDTYLFSHGFFASVLPLLLAYGLLLSITNRSGLSLLMGSLLAAGLFAANAKKIEYLHTPLAPADYAFVQGVNTSNLGLFRHYVNLQVALGVAIAALLAVGLLLRYEPPVFRRHLAGRAGMFVASLAAGWLLLPGNRIGERIYDPVALQISYSPLVSELHAGLFSTLVYANIAGRQAMSIAPDAAAVAQVVKAERARFPQTTAQTATAPAEKPDIVVIQSESFFDPSIMRNIDTRELLPNLHRAQDEGGMGTMSVPTFGGGTLRTEFEVLTGIPLEAYPDLQFPYVQISQPRISSVVTSLSKAGYSTTAIHPNGGEFWNRRTAFRSMGFQDFLTIDEFPPTAYRDGYYMSDHSMTSQIIDSLQQAHGPSFIFAVSIEAHGPYRHGYVNEEAQRAAVRVPSDWPAKAADEYRTYAYHIHHADKELGRLWDYLKQRNRPFLLVFYGDHLPGFELVYERGTFENGRAAWEQHVPWVLLDDKGPAAKRMPEHIYSWMLADEILRRAGIREPNYLRFVGNVGRMLDTEDGAVADQTRAGLRSAARMRLAGRFGAFYREQSGGN